MKYFVYLILFSFNLYSAQLILNRYEEPNQSVDVYHLIDKKPIKCTTEYGEGFANIVRCKLQSPIILDKHVRSDTYFDIIFQDNEIIFKAKRFVQIIPIDDKLIDKIVVTKNKRYRHWAIIGARKQPDILVDKGKTRFNFPVKYMEKSAPYIGALDLNGEPVKNKKGAIYIAKIKKLYKQKKYNDVLKVVKQYMSMHHDSFASEIALYRIRSESKLAKKNRSLYEDLLRDAQQWIEDNPSNKHIPEVHKYIVESYLGKGRLKKAEKYLNLLTSGFSNNKFTQQAQIAYADTIYKQKKRRKEALRIYKDVLYATKDLDTASLAALRIANTYLDFKESSKAKKIFEKVLKSNPEFILEYYNETYKLAKRFADAEQYDMALDIAQHLEKIKDDKFSEDLLKSMAFWEEAKGNSKRALMLYNRYLKIYPKGKYKKFVLRHLDTLMIMQSDSNATKKLQFIDEILAKYSDPDIQKKALEEKVKILMQMQKYQNVLQLENKLKQYKLDKYVQESADKLLLETLDDNKCDLVLKIMQDYNITVGKKHEETLFKCEINLGLFDKAFTLGQKHISSDNLHEKLKWLYLMTKLYKKLDKNKKVILSGNDVLKLSRILGENKYDDILYDIANAYYNLREYDDLMLKTVKEIEQRYPNNIKNVDLFMKVVRYAQARKDLMLELNYAKKVIDLQKRFGISAYSPKIEIIYAHALKKAGKYQKALNYVLKLVNKKMSDIQKAEVLYLAGELSMDLHKTEDAKKYFTKCGEIVKDSEWQKLCAENLQLLAE